MTYSNVLGKLAATALSMCIFTSGATATLTILAGPAWADSSDNTNRGSANRSSTRVINQYNAKANDAGNGGHTITRPQTIHVQSETNSNKMRTISRELSRIDISKITPVTLNNAVSGTVSGHLRDYRDTFRALIVAVEKQNTAYAEFMRLSEMSGGQIARLYPNGGHGLALADATVLYSALRHDAATAQARNQATLQRLTEGQVLSHAAMEDLHLLLGL